MAATIEIRSYHGSTPDSGTDKAGGSVGFKAADNDTVDANNPIVIPTADDAFSFLKQFRFYAASTPSNAIGNLKFYMDGSNGYGTGITLQCKQETGYTDPIALGSADATGCTDAFTYTSGSPLAITGSWSSGTGPFGYYLKVQMKVHHDAVQGTTASEAMSFAYDES
jgi:hypothetical protein